MKSTTPWSLDTLTLTCVGVDPLIGRATNVRITLTLARFGVDNLVWRACDVWFARTLACLWIQNLVAWTLPLFTFAPTSPRVKVLKLGTSWPLGTLALTCARVDSLVRRAGDV